MALHDIMKETDESLALEDAAEIARAAAGSWVQKNAKAQQGQGTSAMSDSSANQPIQSTSRGHPPGLPENAPPGLYGLVPPDQQRPHKSDGVQMGNLPPDNLLASLAAWKAELKSTIHQGQESTLKQQEKALAEQRRLIQELIEAKKQ